MAKMAGTGQYCLPGHLAAMSAAVGEAAETAKKRTTTALTAGVHLTAAVPGTGVGRQPMAQKLTWMLLLAYSAAGWLRTKLLGKDGV